MEGRTGSRGVELISLPDLVQTAEGTFNSTHGDRLRESEGLKLKLPNSRVLRYLIILQGVFAAVIAILQVNLNTVSVSRGWSDPHLIAGVSLWIPLLFFTVAFSISYRGTVNPTRCMLGTAVGVQAGSIVAGLLLILGKAIEILEYQSTHSEDKMPGIIMCTCMGLFATGFVGLAVYISIVFFLVLGCCQRNNENAFA